MKDKFEDLKGKILIKIDKTENEELVFTTHTGDKYKLCHFQDCCEDVRIEDICGDLDDLIGEPILLAEEIINEQDTHHDGVQVPKYCEESFTWTFYKLATRKGSVAIRWFGGSNGYYSETVDFVKVKK